MKITCTCKGVRACAVCELDRKASHRLNVSRIGRAFVFCPNCSRCVEVDSHSGALGPASVQVAGIEVALEAISKAEELYLVEAIETTPWVESQSGRRKQDFGPKVNFKKRKLRIDSFLGFPAYMNVVQKTFANLVGLGDFVPVELCNLKYCPERGSCIDPHFDDSWLWGERLVTLNLLGRTVLTFSQAQDFQDLTSIDDASPSSEYQLTTERLENAVAAHQCTDTRTPSEVSSETLRPLDVVHVLLPRRSLVCVSKAARSQWHHSILREHVDETRLAMTCRELSKVFLDPASANEFKQGQVLLDKARINPDL